MKSIKIVSFIYISVLILGVIARSDQKLDKKIKLANDEFISVDSVAIKKEGLLVTLKSGFQMAISVEMLHNDTLLAYNYISETSDKILDPTVVAESKSKEKNDPEPTKGALIPVVTSKGKLNQEGRRLLDQLNAIILGMESEEKSALPKKTVSNNSTRGGGNSDDASGWDLEALPIFIKTLIEWKWGPQANTRKNGNPDNGSHATHQSVILFWAREDKTLLFHREKKEGNSAKEQLGAGSGAGVQCLSKEGQKTFSDHAIRNRNDQRNEIESP